MIDSNPKGVQSTWIRKRCRINRAASEVAGGISNVRSVWYRKCVYNRFRGRGRGIISGRQGRYGNAYRGLRQNESLALISEEKEGLVLSMPQRRGAFAKVGQNYRAANGPSKVVKAKRRFFCVKKVARICFIVSQVFKYRTVISILAGAGNQGYLAPRRASEFCGKGRCLDCNFLQRIDGS